MRTKPKVGVKIRLIWRFRELCYVCVGGEVMVGPRYVVHYLVSSLQYSCWKRKRAGCFTFIAF